MIRYLKRILRMLGASKGAVLSINAQELIVVTLHNRRAEISENVMKNNLLLKKIMEKE